MLVTVAALWFTGLGARLYDLQIVRHGHYEERARGQQRGELVLTPPRGMIFDSRGRELAMSVDVLSAYVNPRELDDPERTAGRIAQAIGADRNVLTERLAGSDRRFVWVGRQLDPERVQALRDLEIEEVGFTTESKRFYPFGPLVAAVIGFVGVDPTGLAGVELSYDEAVAGEVVRRPVVRDGSRQGRQLYESFGQPNPEPGADLHLTIDSSIQYVAERELRSAIAEYGAIGGSLVMLDPSTGAVLAMASYPGFDPNEYRSAPTEHKANIPLQHHYEPGSTFKLITAAAALESGAVDPFDRFDCGNGSIVFRGKTIRDHKSFDDLSFSEVIAFSSNVGAIRLGEAVGEQRLHEMIRAFGFGSKTGIDLNGEAVGIVHPVEDWNKRSVAYISFGQGISVTPLQLVTAFGAIANGGTLLRPYLVSSIDRDGALEAIPGRPEVTGNPITPKTARTLERMLEGVVEHERGTGKKARIPGYRVAGKTGTAEKPGENGGYADGRYVASFVGFAPARNPAVVALVIVDEPTTARYHGGDAPAAVFSKVAQHALLRLGVPRDEPPLDAPRLVASGPSGQSREVAP